MISNIIAIWNWKFVQQLILLILSSNVFENIVFKSVNCHEELKLEIY